MTDDRPCFCDDCKCDRRIPLGNAQIAVAKAGRPSEIGVVFVKRVIWYMDHGYTYSEAWDSAERLTGLAEFLPRRTPEIEARILTYREKQAA